MGAVADGPGGVRFEPAALEAFAAAIAVAAAVPPEDAGLFAGALVDADLHGVSTHGVSRLGIYMRRIRGGLIDPAAEPVIDDTRPGVLRVDAGNGLGQVAALRTLEAMVPRARAGGVCAATVRGSQHFGAAFHYCNAAARRDMILLATTSCEPSMSPGGGCEAFFGTNPIAVSFPTDLGFTVKVDLATSVVARGNIIAAHKQGRAIPEGWALNTGGEPTTDAAEALAGTVLTMAGHKGYALALMVEIFSSVLSGSAIGPGIGSMYKDMDRPQDVGHFFVLVDIAAFMEPGEFRRRLGETVAGIKACRKRPGVGEILVPGERSHRMAVENARLGVRLDPATVVEIEALALDYGVELGGRIESGIARA
jgi:LDH2 family malate/lactate/ureidoglycolate dehydrogenase